MSNTDIIVYGIGGAGINVSNSIKSYLESLDENFSNFIFETIDTTIKTVQSYPELLDNFWKIESTRVSADQLDGLAGERKDKVVAVEIQKSMQRYIDTIKNGTDKNKYHVVIFSGSGGTGSVAGSLLIKEMLLKEFTVLPIIISDSSTYLKANNTINTIVGLNSISKSTKTALPIGYFINNLKSNTTPISENTVNKDIQKMLELLAMFTSGTVKDIDNKDMNNFLIPSRYSTFEVAPGLYRLSAKIKKVDDKNTILIRTVLSPSVKDVNISVPLLDNKTGIVNDGHINHIGDDIFPIFLTIEKGTINKTVESLQTVLKELESLKNIDSDVLDSLSDSNEDDTGLCL